jgi:putative acetyltransferase
MAIRIVPLLMDSYEAVYALWRQSEGIGLSDADSRESIRSYLERNPGMSFVALADGKIVGAILSGHDGRRGYIYHLAVQREYQKQGIGQWLVDSSLQALGKAGIRKSHIFIFQNNREGIAFWKSIGWIHRLDIGVISRIM